jgi:hypothetical protein
MTVGSMDLKSADLVGCTDLVVGRYRLSASESLNRILAVNPNTGRVGIFEINESHTAAQLIARTPKMDPPPTRVVVPSEPSAFFYVIRPKTSSKPGRITQFIYDAPSSPPLNIEDADASGDIDVTPDDQWLFHTRERPGTLVVRSAATLDLAFEHKCCENPSRIIVDSLGAKVFVFSSTSSKVWVFGYDTSDGSVSFIEAVEMPYVTGLVDVALEKGRLVYVTGDRLVVVRVNQSTADSIFTVLHTYHDPQGAFTSAESFYPPDVDPVLIIDDGSTDPAYLAALEKYRLTGGRDRAVRDPWDSRHFLGRIRAVVGTKNGIAEGDKHPWGRAVVRQLGVTRVAMDPVSGRLIVYGELTFWFRSFLAAGLTPTNADADAVQDQRLSVDSVRGARLVWTGSPAWKLEPSLNRRAVYLDGQSYAVAGTLKNPLLPGPGGTFMAWIYHDGPANGLNAVLAQSDGPGYGQQFGYNPLTEEVSFLGVTASAGALSGGWHHIAATYDGVAGAIKLYIDGAEVSSTVNYSVWAPEANTRLSLGAQVGVSGTADNHFTGWLGDVLVYATVKDALFMAAVFAAGPAGGAPPLPTDQLVLESGAGALLLESGAELLLE